MASELDVVVVGSGPNGLAAALSLAKQGLAVRVVEGKAGLGGGMRTEELTLPGYWHDVCSACHPMGVLSPFLSRLPLEEHGLEWVFPEASVAHPLDHGDAVVLYQDLAQTADGLGRDGTAYRRLLQPFLDHSTALLEDVLAPLRFPKRPMLLARFGLKALHSANSLSRRSFRDERARALFAGCAGHGVVPLDFWFSAAIALIFLVTGHMTRWPVIRGGTEALARAMVSLFRSWGGSTQTDRWVRKASDLPPAKAYLFDTSPAQLVNIAGDLLPRGYRRQLARYRYGPGVFKVDWALREPIPWADKNVLKASTVHLGGTLAEISAAERTVWGGGHPERPYMILVQQSQFDKTRAPAGKHTGYAYCHVPAGSTLDLTTVLENQIERFAPGFKDTIEFRAPRHTAQWQEHNPNYVGGAITGGVADMFQLFTRPAIRLNPYTTPNPHLFLCSASTPPGGGVHGMCGFHAAETVLRRIDKLPTIQPG